MRLRVCDAPLVIRASEALDSPQIGKWLLMVGQFNWSNWSNWSVVQWSVVQWSVVQWSVVKWSVGRVGQWVSGLIRR